MQVLMDNQTQYKQQWFDFMEYKPIQVKENSISLIKILPDSSLWYVVGDLGKQLHLQWRQRIMPHNLTKRYGWLGYPTTKQI